MAKSDSDKPDNRQWYHERGKEITIDETFRFPRAAIFYAFEHANVFSEVEREALAEAITGALFADMYQNQQGINLLKAHFGEKREGKRKPTPRAAKGRQRKVGEKPKR